MLYCFYLSIDLLMINFVYRLMDVSIGGELPYDPSCLLVGWLAGWSVVCHNFPLTVQLID